MKLYFDRFNENSIRINSKFYWGESNIEIKTIAQKQSLIFFTNISLNNLLKEL